MSDIAEPGSCRRVILESPFAGDTESHTDYARACVRDCLDRGEAPLASHLLYTQPGILRDDVPEQRQLGISAGLAWGAAADATVVYEDLGVSKGMEAGIGDAEAAGRPVERRSLPGWGSGDRDDALARYCRAVRDTVRILTSAAQACDASSAPIGARQISSRLEMAGNHFLQEAVAGLCRRGAEFGLPLSEDRMKWFGVALMGRGAERRLDTGELQEAAAAWQAQNIRALCTNSDHASQVESLRRDLHDGRAVLDGRTLRVRPLIPIWRTRASPSPYVIPNWRAEDARAWVQRRLTAVAWLARHRRSPGVHPAECRVGLPESPPFQIERGQSVPHVEILREFGRLCPEILGCRPRRGGVIEFHLSPDAAAAVSEDRTAWEAESRARPGFPAHRGADALDDEAEPAAHQR